MAYRDEVCNECGQHLDCEATIKDYERMLDEKAMRIASLQHEIDTPETKLDRVKYFIIQTRLNEDNTDEHTRPVSYNR